MFPTIEIFGKAIDAYALFNTLGAFVVLLYNLSQYQQKTMILSKYSCFILTEKRKKRELLSKVVFFAIAELIVITIIQGMIANTVNSIWAKLITKNNANYFGNIYFFMPLFLLACALLAIPPLKQLDYITPGFCLNLVFAKIACFCTGCCFGHEIAGSFYYSVSRHRCEIPIQAIELLIALMMFFVLRAYQKRNRHPGSVFPIYMILYSATRFLTEFMRDDFPSLWHGLSIYHFQCLAGVLLGLLALVFVVKKANSIGFLTEGLPGIQKFLHM